MSGDNVISSSVADKGIKTWNDYLCYGILFAMLLSILKAGSYGYYQILFVIMFMAFTGIKNSYRLLLTFIKCNPIVLGMAVVYAAYNFVSSRDVPSCLFPLTVFCVIFAGFCVSTGGRDVSIAHRKLWMVLFSISFINIFAVLEGRSLYFANADIEMGILVVMAVMTFLFIDDGKIILAGEAVIIFLGVLLLRRGGLDFSNAFLVKDAAQEFSHGGIMEKILGHGFLQLMKNTNGISNNTMGELLYDYGLVAVILFCVLFIYALYVLITDKDKENKKQSFLLMVLMIMSLFYSAVYWENGAFLLFAEIGVFLGVRARSKDK
ncbi:hypothetical protein [Butyrivibrio sp. XPD2002]|uniref:hypothetical protein n=1 Tax=Butyrivibrio sp. XPD2002 TaxID=1280665 RepID=UPI000413BC40|nr:hypothetical protein [Butyrivibrio sp. XPD2002]